MNRRKSDFTSNVVNNGVSGKRHRFEIITLGIGQDVMGLKNFVQDHPLEWKHGFMDGPEADDLSVNWVWVFCQRLFCWIVRERLFFHRLHCLILSGY
jgi:hypothetical protein